MAARTSRFGLNYYGGSISGSLSDNGGQFTRRDRLVIDRLFAAFEVHDHGGGERLGNPTGAPGLVLDATGTLPGGTTYYYTTSYIDQFGLETARSDEASVSTPAQISTPNMPGLDTLTGGSLTSSLTYSYGVTALDDSGGETRLSQTNASTLVSTQGTVRVTPQVPAGATQISIWRRSSADSGWTRLVTQADATPFDDDGSIVSACPCEPNTQPPTTNTTGSSSAVTISAPTGDIVLPTLVKRWRIYRSTTSGAYGAQSLLVEISTTEEGTNQLVQTYIDDGTVTLSDGSPPINSQTLTPSEALTGGGGGAGSGYVLLRSAGDVVWRLVSSLDGAIETRLFPVPTGVESFFADQGVGFYDSGDVIWRLTVDDDGILTTTITATETQGEQHFGYGQGPEIPTVDGAVSWRAGVATDGSLETYGQNDSSIGLDTVEDIVDATYAVIAKDTSKVKRFTSDCTVDLPDGLPIGTRVELMAFSAGGITVQAGGTATVHNGGAVAQYNTVLARCVATDIWVVED